MINCKLSRRAAFSAAILSPFLIERAWTAPNASNIEIGESLQVRDFRLYSTNDVTRFLVELHNTTDRAIDSPGVGLVWSGSNDDFAWAGPVLGVMHPRSSVCLLGVAPASLRETEWHHFQWVLCNELESVKAEEISQFKVGLDYSIEVRSADTALVEIDVHNLGAPLTTTVTVVGLVRDENGRVCGSTLPVWINNIAPGESQTVQVAFRSDWDYPANPLPLLATLDGIRIDFSLQPWPEPVSPSCNPVMPWNR